MRLPEVALRLGNIEFRNIATNSKNVKRGDLFVAIKGENFDGHDFVEEAFEKGAIAAVVTSAPVHQCTSNPLIVVKDTREELSKLAAKFYNNPSSKLNVIGITGTNGKTTTSFLVDKIFTDAGFKTGLIGTVFYKIGNKVIESNRTTPDASELNNILHQMTEVKTNCAILEVSSHALEQKRVNDIYYNTALFTNLTPEHLDYHKNMDTYFMAKAKIFNNLKEDGIAILNKDDQRTEALIKKINKKIFTYGIDSKADIMATGIESIITGSKFKAITPRGGLGIRTKLLGLYNILNILAAISIACVHDLNLKQVEASINSFNIVPGRLEPLEMGQDFSIFIDYAHTEDALRKVLSALTKYAKKRIITVFGCGGDRDKSKRPHMGKIATEISSYTIITNDNPRTENPENIAEDIEKGINPKTAKYSIILDRKEAIRRALNMAQKGDIVLVAGKGHETVQVIGDKRIRFDDREVVKTLLKRK